MNDSAQHATRELLPCPFCGSKPSVKVWPKHPLRGSVEISCENEECLAIINVEDDDEDVAYEGWNRRFASSADAETTPFPAYVMSDAQLREAIRLAVEEDRRTRAPSSSTRASGETPNFDAANQYAHEHFASWSDRYEYLMGEFKRLERLRDSEIAALIESKDWGIAEIERLRTIVSANAESKGPEAKSLLPSNSEATVAEHCALCVKGFPKTESGTHYGTQRLGMIPDTPCQEEYLRRNLNVAKACGAAAGARAILNRLAGRKRKPKWLVDAVQGIYQRTKPLSRELAAYRDEARPTATLRDPKSGR